MRRRKIFVLAGYGISGLARPLIAFVAQAWQIVPIRMADRVGKGVRTAPRDALIAAAVDASARGRAYGFHRAMDHAGAVVGPLLALASLGALFLVFDVADTELALRITFGLALIPGVLAFLALLLWVREPASAPAADVDAPARSGSRGLDRNFFVYLAVLTLFTLGNSSDAFLLYRVSEALGDGVFPRLQETFPALDALAAGISQRIPLDVLLLPLVWAFFHVIKVIFSTPFGSLSDRIGRKIVISLGWTVYVLVYLAFAFLDRVPGAWQLPAIFGLFAVYALYHAFTEGVEKALVADMVPASVSGTAFGWYNFSTGLAALPASVIFGIFYEFGGAHAAFLWGALLAILALVGLLWLVRTPPASV
jgi:MFS family permease